VSEPTATEIAAKGRRVTGMFVAMIGCGLVLESSAAALGAVLAVGGLAVLASGFLRLRPSLAAPEEAQREQA
jgi:hypothetical protein